MAREKYRALVGLDYPPNNKEPKRRAEPGDVVDDLPPKVIGWMLEIGAIEKVEPGEATGGES